MKIDFIKEVKGDVTWYYTNIDGQYASGSLSYNSERAMESYERIVSGTAESEITIIRTTNIEDGTTITKP